eukprot:g9966.t1
MSGWDRSEVGDTERASGRRNIRQQRDLYEPVLRGAPSGTNGDQAVIYKGAEGSPSSPPSYFPNGGPPPLPPGDSRKPAPPAQGEDPSFDAKVAAEYFRLKDAKTSLRDGGPSDSTSGRLGQTQGAPQPGAFESDVERAMRELEVEVGLAKRTNSRSRYASPTSQPPPPPPPTPPPPPPPPLPHTPAASTRPELSDHGAAGDAGSTLLSQMDMRRVSPGGGKGRPGGLRDLWDNGGGNEGHSPLPGAERHQHPQQRRAGGGGGGSSAQQTQRHGPGLKGMWGGEQPEESAQPKRQGPGLRGLWSGPDTAAADAARSESQAAYMSALNRDALENRAFSEEPQGQQQQRLHQQRRQGRARQDEPCSPYSSARGGVDGGRVSEPGTSLPGIGTPRDGITPRQQRRPERDDGADGGDSLDRALDRARKAAYADELRKQIAEKEARMAMDEGASTSGRRRASTGGRRAAAAADGGSGSGSGDSYNRPPSTPASHGRGSYLGSSAPGRSDGSPGTYADRSHDRWPSAASSTLPPGSGRSSNAGEGHVTAARRRLVEDVYGGGGMGAALGGAGYRRASTGSHGVRSDRAGSHTASAPGQAEGWDRGEPTAFEGADAATSQGGSSYLRTGAGVQNLRESEHGESRMQKRAAALEQQRALEAQIAEKARAKREEEEERKREEEEEARQQREQQRRLEADAEEGRRRKQAEQHEQLEGLYRQQEAALRRKRGGGRHLKDGGVYQNSRAPAHGGSTSPLDGSHETAAAAGYPSEGEVGVGESLRQSQAQQHQQRRAVGLAPPSHSNGLGGVSRAGPETPRRRSDVPDVDDLPAGAQARAQVLRSSPRDHDGGLGAASTPRLGSASSARRGNTPPAASAAGGGRFKGANGLGLTNPPTAEGARGRTSTTTAAAFEGGVGDGAAPSGPPLQAHSLLVPVSSAALFPPFPADNADATGPNAAAAFLREDDERPPMQQRSFAASGAGGRSEHPVASSAGRFAGGVAAEPPQDEMDAFVTRWQDEHLRRRGFRGQKQHQQDGAGIVLPPDQSNERHTPSSGSLGGRTICRSPPRGLNRGSPRAPGYAAGGGRARSSSGVPGGRTGEQGDLEESLAATSRMLNPPSLPRPSSVSHAGEKADFSGDGRRQAQRRPLGGFGVEVEGEDDGAANLSERSLASDSILFYLSGRQRESMAEEATATAAPSSPMAAAAGRFTAASGTELRSRSPGTSASRPGLPREPSEAGGGGEGGHDPGSNGGNGTVDRQGVGSSSAPLAGSVRRGEGGDQGQMSPLTRLLAETPVRLEAPADRLPKQGPDPSAAPSFGPDPQAHGLPTGGNDRGGTRTRRSRPAAAAAAAAVGGSRDDGGNVAGSARRARALWGAPSAGAFGGGGGVAIAEALTRRGMPWEEMPASEGRVSSSGAPPLR